MNEEGEGKEEGEDAARYIASLRDDEVVQVTGPHGSLTYFGKGINCLQGIGSIFREKCFLHK